jgi:hypothetical protein
MAIDWIATLQVQADLVLQVSTEVSKALDAPDLTLSKHPDFIEWWNKVPGILTRLSRLWMNTT